MTIAAAADRRHGGDRYDLDPEGESAYAMGKRRHRVGAQGLSISGLLGRRVAAAGLPIRLDAVVRTRLAAPRHVENTGRRRDGDELEALDGVANGAVRGLPGSADDQRRLREAGDDAGVVHRCDRRGVDDDRVVLLLRGPRA